MIHIQDLSLRFDRNILFEHYSLSVQRGERVVVTGNSGSGKTSLLHCLAGFTIPQEGSIYIDEALLSVDKIDRVRSKIGYLPQEVALDLPTGRDLLLYPFSFRTNRASLPSESLIHTTLASLLLPIECLDQPLIELSGGQKQRLLFASVWLLDRPILLLDEPTSALDDASVEAMIALLASRPESTIFSISHDRRWIEAMGRTISLSSICTTLQSNQ